MTQPIHQTNASGRRSEVRKTAFLWMTLVMTAVSATPMFFIHGDMKPRSASRLAILPDTTHVTLMQRIPIIVPMVNGFLDAKP